MGTQTALHQVHVDRAAKFVDFSGFRMPLHYGSMLGEHQVVRESAGMFDLSHISIIDVHGARATHWLRIMLSNDCIKLSDGQGMYSCLCKEDGGVVDDLLAFRLDENHYRFYVDSARREKDMAWLRGHIIRDVEVTEVTGNCIIAVQGPDAVCLATRALDALGLPMAMAGMPRFSAQQNESLFISRTGYTGEDGVEITVPAAQAVDVWNSLAEQEVAPAGLGARDSLRLEAGFGLYGQDIDERHTPAESGIARTIDINDDDRFFIGRDVVEDHKRFGGRFLQMGLVLEGQGLLRRGANVELVGQPIGRITSGGYSPARAVSIGLARVTRSFTGSCDVTVKERLQPARVTSVPFVPHGLARE